MGHMISLFWTPLGYHFWFYENVEPLFGGDQDGRDGGGRTRLRRLEGRRICQWRGAGGWRWQAEGLERETHGFKGAGVRLRRRRSDAGR